VKSEPGSVEILASKYIDSAKQFRPLIIVSLLENNSKSIERANALR
jgi:hypothetical protein